MRVDVVILQHRCHLIKGCVFLVQRLVGLGPPDLAQQPFASLETTVLIVPLVFMSFLQKQNADCESENDNESADDVWQKEWETFKDSAVESPVE